MGKEVHSGPGSRDPGDVCWMSEKVKEREDSTEHPPSSFLGGSVTLEMGSVRTDEFLSRNKQEHFFFKGHNPECLSEKHAAYYYKYFITVRAS